MFILLSSIRNLHNMIRILRSKYIHDIFFSVQKYQHVLWGVYGRIAILVFIKHEGNFKSNHDLDWTFFLKNSEYHFEGNRISDFSLKSVCKYYISEDWELWKIFLMKVLKTPIKYPSNLIYKILFFKDLSVPSVVFEPKFSGRIRNVIYVQNRQELPQHVLSYKVDRWIKIWFYIS